MPVTAAKTNIAMTKMMMYSVLIEFALGEPPAFGKQQFAIALGAISSQTP